jgi:site-specific DNA-methyltransferase (adenine-specific)
VKWSDVHKNPLYTNDAVARAVRRKKRPPQWRQIGEAAYKSVDGGPRLMRSVMFARSCHGHALHPTQKPVEVVAPLVEYSCPKDGTVLDPFMGSGSTGIAALQKGRKFIGIEIRQKYFDIARRRIEQAQSETRAR